MGCKTNIRLKVLREEKSHKMKNPFKNNSERKREHGFKLFALPKMKVKPTRDSTQKTEKESRRKKCRRSLTITTVETLLSQGALFFTGRKNIIKGVKYYPALRC